MIDNLNDSVVELADRTLKSNIFIFGEGYLKKGGGLLFFMLILVKLIYSDKLRRLSEGHGMSCRDIEKAYFKKSKDGGNIFL